MKHPIQKFVLFGATGDLSQRMVWPSLYHLCREKLVPPTLTFVGSARHPMPNDEFRKFVDGALRKMTLPMTVSVNAGETSFELAKLGFGLLQVPRYHIEPALASGALVEVLQAFPPSPTYEPALVPSSLPANRNEDEPSQIEMLRRSNIRRAVPPMARSSL